MFSFLTLHLPKFKFINAPITITPILFYRLPNMAMAIWKSNFIRFFLLYIVFSQFCEHIYCGFHHQIMAAIETDSLYRLNKPLYLATVPTPTPAFLAICLSVLVSLLRFASDWRLTVLLFVISAPSLFPAFFFFSFSKATSFLSYLLDHVWPNLVKRFRLW